MALQFDVGPVIKRIAQSVRNGGGPGLKLTERIGVAGAEPLRHAIGTHRPPFVMIALEPDFKKIIEGTILGDVLWRQVAMIIEDRLVFRVGMVQPAGSAGAQE